MTTWNDLLDVAIQCPSPHNVQPWHVRIVNECEADLFIEVARTLPKADPGGSVIILTMGMFLDALSITAANHGLEFEYEMYHDPRYYPPLFLKSTEKILPFARMKICPGTPSASPYADRLFFTRRTSRISLDPRPVEQSAFLALSRLASEWGQRYVQITDSVLIERIVNLNIDAVFEDMNTPDFHDELTTWFRFTNRSSRRTRDGLDFRCMNTSRTSLWISARFPRLLQNRISHPLFRMVYHSQLGTIPTMGLFAGDGFWEPELAMRTGRFLLRFWLEATKHGLYIHPYGNLVTNQKAATRILENTGTEKIWFVFKIGHSKEPPKSYRRPIAKRPDASLCANA